MGVAYYTTPTNCNGNMDYVSDTGFCLLCPRDSAGRNLRQTGPGGCAPAYCHASSFLRSRSNSVRETNARPAPATGLFKGVLPQQAETAVSSIAGNRGF